MVVAQLLAKQTTTKDPRSGSIVISLTSMYKYPIEWQIQNPTDLKEIPK